MPNLYKKNSTGWINGFIGVLLFSGSLPATRLAVLSFSPLFVTVARASIAGILALAVLLIFKQKRPGKKDFYRLIITSAGVVIGFPLFSAIALLHITSANSIVFIGILPLLTALFGLKGSDDRPPRKFWIFSLLGAFLVVGFAVYQGFSTSPFGNFLMLLAVLMCGLGYAEGAKLSKTLGGWQVISWALVTALPLMLILLFSVWPPSFKNIEFSAWAGLAYVSVFSMFVGFVFWYKGLAQGGIAYVSQLQLLQPFFALILASVLLNEQISALMVIVTTGVIFCVAASKKFSSQKVKPN
ncbi:MAG TPA: DMT family transporter [Pelobium sp.]